MSGIKAWISEHPYLASALGITLIVGIYLVLHSGSSSSSQQVSTNPGGLSDAAYTAQLAAGAQSDQTAAALSAQQGQTAAALTATLAQAQVVNNQTAAAQAVGLQQILTSGETSDYTAAAGLSATQDTNAAAVTNTASNNSTAVQLAGIQSQVSENTTAAQLQLGLNTNQTSLNLAGIQLQGLQDTNQTALAVTQSNNATAGAIDALNENTQLSEVTQQVGAENLQTSTAGSVAQNEANQQAQQVADAYSLGQQQLNEQEQEFTGVSQYGGNYSSNQATILATVAGAPSVGVAIQGSSAQQAASENSTIASIFNGAFGAVKTVATAGTGVPGQTVAGSLAG